MNQLKGVAPVYVWLLLMDCREAYVLDTSGSHCPGCVQSGHNCDNCLIDHVTHRDGYDSICALEGRETLRLLEDCVREVE